jgi:hypothetical protein
MFMYKHLFVEAKLADMLECVLGSISQRGGGAGD